MTFSWFNQTDDNTLFKKTPPPEKDPNNRDIVPLTYKDGTTEYHYMGNAYKTQEEAVRAQQGPAWFNKGAEFVGKTLMSSPTIRTVAKTAGAVLGNEIVQDALTGPGEETAVTLLGDSLVQYGLPRNIAEVGRVVYPGPMDAKAPKIKIPPNTPALATVGVADVSTLNRVDVPTTYKPVTHLEMTSEQAAEHWGKVTEAPLDELGVTSAVKGADRGAMSRIVRYTKSGREADLNLRLQKQIISSQKENSPLRYLVKYSGGDIMKADSHHILDIDFWGRALDNKNNDILSNVLWKDKIHTGNAGNNIVWAWASKRGSFDHGTLHRLYENIPARQHVEKMIADGTWQGVSAKGQARMLREVAYMQHRVTNNFFRTKLSFIMRNNPELMKMHPTHLRNHILKHPEKYAEIKVIDPRVPEEVQGLYANLINLPYSGQSNKLLKEVFGLDSPKAGSPKYQGSTTQKNFDLRLDHRLNKALKARQTEQWTGIAKTAMEHMEKGKLNEARWRSANTQFTWAPDDGKNGRGYIDILKDTAGDDDVFALKKQFFSEIEKLPSGTKWTLEANSAQKYRIYKRMFRGDKRFKPGGDTKLLAKKGIDHFVLTIP